MGWLQEVIASVTSCFAGSPKVRSRFSRARVTQIMNLLALPEEIQEFLLNPPASLEFWP